MRKLLFCIFMMLPVSLFGQDCAGETDCLPDSLPRATSQNGPMVNLDAGSDNAGDCEQDLNITFNCAGDEMAAIMRFLQNYEQGIIAQIDAEIKTIEDGVAADVANLQDKLGELKELKNGWLQRFETINLIANGDIEGLKNLDQARFEQDFSIEIDGDKFENNLGGRLASHLISGDNMLAWVLFKSATNKTQEDDEKTLQMLKIILENGIDSDSKAERTYWIMSEPESVAENLAEKEFVTELPLVELAILYSFPRAVEILLEYGAKFIKKRVDFCIYCRIISDLTSLCVKKTCVGQGQGGISKEQLEQLKITFAHFVEVLGIINFDGIAKDRDGHDVINAFNDMFYKYYAQACESYSELAA